MKKILLILLIIMVAVTGCSGKAAAEGKNDEPEVKPEEIIPEKEVFVKEFEGSFIVSVDNHIKAYPQSGLDKADQVIELLAEGGITRFLAFYDSYHAEKIGPVRSARYYFVEIVKGYPSAFAHAGGNTDALNLVPYHKIMDLDEIYNSGAAFYRTKDRKPPHNLYTTTELMLKNANAKKYPIKSLEGLPIGEVSGGSKADIIDIPYSKKTSYYHVVTYMFEDGKFWRYVNGKAFETDQKVKIFADNLILMETPTRTVVKEEVQSEMNVFGSGKAVFFIDGLYYEGTWEKAKAADPFTFQYNGEPMKFKEGKTWIQVVPNFSEVTFKAKEAVASPSAPAATASK